MTIKKEAGHYKPIMGFLLRSRRADQREEDNNGIGRFQAIAGTKLMCGMVMMLDDVHSCFVKQWTDTLM